MVKSKFLLTMQHNEDRFLPIFLKHYCQYFDKKNIFVIDHGSDSNLLPPDFNRIYIPRDRPFSEFERMNFIKEIANGLLRYYDVGIYADCDELIYLSDFNYEALPSSSPIYVAGFECTMVEIEGNKKLIGIPSPHECKPLIFNKVPDWVPGFHTSKNIEPQEFLSIPLAHLKFLSQEEFSIRGLSRNKTHENMLANEKNMGIAYQWAKSETDFNEFYKKIDDHIKEKKTIANFVPIKSETIFKKIGSSTTLYIPSTFTYFPRGTYRDQSSIVDITDYFPVLSGNY